MWFGTQDGLNRYDGVHFRKFRHDLKNPASISDNEITVVYEDRYANLWIGTITGGLNKFDRSTEQFTAYHKIREAGTWIDISAITSICGGPEESRSIIYVGTEDHGLLAFDIENNRFLDPDSLPLGLSRLKTANITKVLGSKDQTSLWVGTNGDGLFRFQVGDSSFQKYALSANRTGGKNATRVTALFQEENQSLWAGTENGLYRYEKDSDTFEKIRTTGPGQADNPEIKAIFVDHKDFVWIGTWGTGVRRFDKAGQTYFEYKNVPGSPFSLGDNKVFSLTGGQFGTIWIGTWGMGISKYDLYNDAFEYFHHHPGKANSLSSNDVMALLEDQDENLWIGTTEGGLSRYDTRTKTFKHYKHKEGNRNTLSDNTVLSLLEDHDKNIWIGTWTGGLNRFDPQRETFTHFKHDPADMTSISDNTIWHLFEDSYRNLWIGTKYGGLNKYDRNTGRFQHFRHDPNDPHSISDDGVPAILEDKNGSIWVGTSAGGLNQLNASTGVFKHYSHDSNDPGSLSANCVWSLYQDKKDVLWIGTKMGLNKFIAEKGTFKSYSEDDGLANHVIYSIEEDYNGFLWLSTNHGLSRFDPATETFENYDASNGLQSNEFNLGASESRKNGELVFGGVGGFTLFDPRAAQGNLYAPKVVLTSFQINNKLVPIGAMADGRKLLAKSIAETDAITLSYRDRIFLLEFAGLHYSDPKQNQYAYMLQGFDQDWNYVGNRNFASYTNVPPGNYIFRVKAANNRNIWNEAGTSLKISIAPPIYSLWWFKFITAIAFLLIVFLLHWLKILSVRRRNRELAKINAELNNQIRERQIAERALRDNEKKLQSIFRSAPIGIGLVGDSIFEVNEKISEISGYGHDELIGKGAEIFYTSKKEFENLTHESEKQITEKGVSLVETQWVNKNRTKTIDVLINSTPVEMNDWSKGILFTVLDITDHNKTEAARRDSEEKYRNLIEQSGDAIYLLYKRKFVIVNEKFLSMFKVTREFVNGPEFDFMKLVAPSSHRIIEERVRKQLNGEKLNPNYEFIAIRSDGEEIEVEASVSYIQYKDGIATQGIIREITDRKRLEAQLRQAQKMEAVGQLAGGVAHDFNNILTVINGYCDLLMLRELPENIRSQVEHIQQASQRATRLTSQLLAFSRKQMIQPKILNLNQLISDYLKLLGRLLGEDIEIITLPEPDLNQIFIDPGQIEQVIMNLAVNARDAMPYGGKLVIETKNILIDEAYVKLHSGAKPGNYIMLIISDNGYGIDEKTRAHIFEPFFTTKGREKGTGLGLATVYGIVKQNNGFIYVYSETGRGTTFKIYFPRVNSVENQVSQKTEVSTDFTGNGIILLVEDDDAVREVTQSSLEGYGYKVISAENGEQALRYYQQNGKTIDLLLTDVIMPVMSGKELAGKLREINPYLKVLFFSGYTDNAIVHHGVLEGNVNFIQKPYSNIDLAKKVKDVLQ